MRKWTEKQKQAIDLPSDLLVSAAAGSGKTAVLTERIARHVTEGTDIENILVVTFTKAAAAEMKKRIADRLGELAIETNDEAAQKRLLEQAQKAEHASISTIHSFCSRVLRRHFHAADLDPSFRTADETQKAMLMDEAMEELLEGRYDSGSPEFLRLLELMETEKNLIPLLFSLYGFMESQPDPESYVEKAIGYFKMDAKALSRCEPLGWLVESSKEKIRDAVPGFSLACSWGVPMKQKAQLDDELLRVRALSVLSGYDEYREALLGMKFEALRWNGAKADEDVKNDIAAARDHLKKVIKEQSGLFRRSLDEEAAFLKELLHAVVELKGLIYDFDRLYAQEKLDAGVIDYADMEHKALRVLRDPEISKEYREKFEYIFIDEYQDTNDVQESIIGAVRRESNVFMVGDVKQSIYRFRLAEPGIFLKRYEQYKNASNGRKVDLNANFRSSKSVIGLVNAVFEKIMRKDTCAIEYDADAQLVMGREEEEHPAAAELHILEKAGSGPEEGVSEEAGDEEAPDDACEEGEEQELNDAQKEALLAAEKIRQLTGENGPLLTDPKTFEKRHYAYSDIAVLLRDNKTAQVFNEVLELEGIPAYAQPSGGYFDAAEVKTVMNLLRVIDNKRQDIPLTGVLRSKIGDFSAKELARVRAGNSGECVYESLLRVSFEDTELGKKAKAFTDLLERWRKDAQVLGVGQLIESLLEETGYYDFVGALSGGARRQANLDALLERARDYERSFKRGLWSFIRFMDAAKKSESIGEAQVSASDVVNILTIHRSKGLEFPAVILAGLGRGFNCGSHPQKADKEWGFGLEFVTDSVKRRTLNLSAITKRAYEADIAEEMRVLYVGMTRARDVLILIGTAKNTEEAVEKAGTGLTPSSILGAKRNLDWILGALMDGDEADAVRAALAQGSSDGKSGILKIFCHPARRAALSASALTSEDFSKWAKEAVTADASVLEERFAFDYPGKNDVGIPGKTSVSALSRTDAVIIEAPAFARRQTMTAADKGTAAHLLMQLIRIGAHTEDSVKEELERLTTEGYMTPEQADAADKPSVARFFASDLGKRLCASDTVKREWEFNHAKPARELFDTDSRERVLLQGVIDCAFLEDGAWVLLDYKTDRVPEGVTPERAAEKHRLQIELYKKALAELTGKPVKEAYIHLLRIGESVRM